jgi:hypothetical protein
VTDEQRRVRDDSDELLDALDDLKRLEKLKRDETYSSPDFHRLANEVEDQARHVFRVAAEENLHGDLAQHADLTPNDVRPSDDRSN